MSSKQESYKYSYGAIYGTSGKKTASNVDNSAESPAAKPKPYSSNGPAVGKDPYALLKAKNPHDEKVSSAGAGRRASIHKQYGVSGSNTLAPPASKGHKKSLSVGDEARKMESEIAPPKVHASVAERIAMMQTEAEKEEKKLVPPKGHKKTPSVAERIAMMQKQSEGSKDPGDRRSSFQSKSQGSESIHRLDSAGLVSQHQTLLQDKITPSTPSAMYHPEAEQYQSGAFLTSGNVVFPSERNPSEPFRYDPNQERKEQEQESEEGKQEFTSYSSYNSNPIKVQQEEFVSYNSNPPSSSQLFNADLSESNTTSTTFTSYGNVPPRKAPTIMVEEKRLDEISYGSSYENNYGNHGNSSGSNYAANSSNNYANSGNYSGSYTSYGSNYSGSYSSYGSNYGNAAYANDSSSSWDGMSSYYNNNNNNNNNNDNSNNYNYNYNNGGGMSSYYNSSSYASPASSNTIPTNYNVSLPPASTVSAPPDQNRRSSFDMQRYLSDQTKAEKERRRLSGQYERMDPSSLFLAPGNSQYYSPSVPHKSPLGCTLLAAPQQEDSNTARHHTFALTRSLTPLTCDFCHRLRTSSNTFSCSVCGISVHKRCVSLVPKNCTGIRKTANEPISFVSSRVKHRGLRPLNLVTEKVVFEGYLRKKKSYGKGDWNRRYFILIHLDTFLYYFSKKPTSEFTCAVPSGGYPLTEAIISFESSVDSSHSYCLKIEQKLLEQPVILCADTFDESQSWIEMLNGAIVESQKRALEELNYSPNDNDWSKLRTKTVSLFYLNLKENGAEYSVLGDRSSLFRETLCFDGDECYEQKLFVKIEGIHDLEMSDEAEYFITLRVYYAGHNLVNKISTSPSSTPKWGERWYVVCDSISSIPPESVMMVSAYKLTKDKKKFKRRDEGNTECLGHCHLSVTKYGSLRSGGYDLYLWPGEGSPIHFDYTNLERKGDAPFVRITLPQYALPVVYSSFLQPRVKAIPFNPSYQDLFNIDSFDLPNPLVLLSTEERIKCWNNRDSLPISSLPLVLSGCDFTDPSQRVAAKEVCIRALNQGIPLSTAFHLLSSEYASSFVREIAARSILQNISNENLMVLFVMVVNSLRFEPFEWNTLAELIIFRVSKTEELYHTFFWKLYGQADLSLPQGPRFRFLRKVLQCALAEKDQGDLVREAQICGGLCGLSKDARRKDNLSVLLKPFETFPPVRLPISVSHKAFGVDVSKCKVMTSNAAPILLAFKPEKEIPNVIIKAGDDMRQDEFSLCFAGVLNKIFDISNIKAKVLTYSCVNMGNLLGMIEVVPGCKSVSQVQGKITGAFDKDCILNYLGSKVTALNPWGEIMERFKATLVGCVIFEYVLGIGDRHGDNILIKPNGEIFHIDFGYLLGNKTMFGPFRREPQPFTFTPLYLEMLGGKQGKHYRQFTEECCKAFNAVRKYHVFLTGICMMAMGQSMPYLKKINDVHYVFDALCPNLSDSDAAKEFIKLINTALETKRQQWNDVVHNAVNKMKK